MPGTVIDDEGRIDGPTLTEYVLRAASGLAALGIGPGDTVALLTRNGRNFVEAVLAAQHLGACAVPVNYHGAPPEIAHVLEDCGATVLVGDPDLLDPVRFALPPLVRVLEGGREWAEWRDRHPPSTTPPAAEIPSMIYTSGTSGRPKGVRRLPATPEQASLIAAIRRRLYGLMPDMRLLVPAPLYHAAPHMIAMTTLRQGGTLVLPKRFDPDHLRALIEKHRITHLFAVPTMFVRLLALPAAARRRDLSSLRSVIHAGAATPVPVKRAIIDWFGPVVQEYYGSTEMGAVTFCDSADWLRRPGSVGRAVPPYRIAILREDGSEASPGEDGEIIVDASGLADFTYHNDPAKRAAMARGPALASGDVGHLDAEGYLYVTDRKTDMILRGGVNIYPAEIEAELMAISGIRDCAVIGRPDPDLGERVVAYVVQDGRTRLDAAGITDRLADRLARFKLPAEILFVSTLPREESGKLFKRRLRDG